MKAVVVPMPNEMTFEQFRTRYATEAVCAEALFHARWPNGFNCPSCGHRECYELRTRRLPLYECRSCRRQTSLIVGTIMEGSRTPLTLWFQALFLHARPQGISASRLASVIGTTYKTAWLICHKIRHAMSACDSQELLSGLVRVNYGKYGRPYNPTVFRHPQKQPLILGGTVCAEIGITHLKIKQVPDDHLIQDRITSRGSHEFVQKHIYSAKADVTVIIQEFSIHRYRPLLEIASNASNWINWTFSGIGPKHLQSYLDQYCFGYNQLQRKTDSFQILLTHSAATPTLTYPDLIQREDQSAQRKIAYEKLLREAC